ncbi:MAG: hypothetical protein JO112_20260 [Planctomycetes bacterium]|nr:hypothetical protein [Planctomycetota bacterium]
MKVAIVGSRSWLAPHIETELKSRHLDVEYIAKGDVPYEDMTAYSAVILIAGRARPDKAEIAREEELVNAACTNQDQPRRMLYISSCAVDRWERGSRPLSLAGEQYVLTKKRCETMVCGKPNGIRKADGFAIRLPVIFGEGQSLDSDMLVPSVARAHLTKTPLELAQPLMPFELVHVSDAARAVVDFLGEHDPLPVRSVRSDLHTPLRLVSVMAPGIPMIVRQGWQYHPATSTPEAGQRHLTEVNYRLKDGDLVRTMEWYDQYDRARLAEIQRQTELEGPDMLALPPGKGIIDV